MIKTLDRYVLRSFLISALLCFVTLMSLRVVADLFVNMDEFTKKRSDEQDPLFIHGMHYIIRQPENTSLEPRRRRLRPPGLLLLKICIY